MSSSNGLNVNKRRRSVELSAREPYANLTLNQQIFSEALGQYFGIPAENIIPTAGTTGAIEAIRNHVFKTSETKHPAFLMVSPGYWRARESFQGLGFEPVDFKTRHSDFTIDEEEIIRAVRAEKPELLYLSLPNNPTGAVFDPDIIIERITAETTMVLDLTLPSGVINRKLLIKTLYHKFRGRKNLFLIASTSKSHGTAEHRIGWIVCADASDAEELRMENRNGVSTISIAEGLKHIGKSPTSTKKIERSFALLKRNEQGGRYEIVKPRQMVETSYVLVRSYVNANRLREILERNNMHALWGSKFGLTDDYIRLDTLEPSNIKIFVDAINSLKEQAAGA
ncbi:MAG: aminotransferase class I/II-fold pyridoxal phosphate-dependent enzyme [Pyrinomonadaceae bacterium]|nr:aminotransferase class I/II-fold pyridoxal phosphate-dependent enzyme [Pyrinomonadaceae bacterium]MBD0372775.1 aminotransferase class I/II-fold pyridoxal phosphate-dependent enzyme [Pyrinomonadaceae bacterium]